MPVNSARLFVDLILKVSGDCYANWSPPRMIEVGDYGVINSETAEFEREGSIYDPNFEPDLQIASNHPKEECPPEDQLFMVSRGWKQRAFDAELKANHPELFKSNIKGRWEFQGGKGAILVVFKPAESRIQNKGVLFQKLQYNKILADKALVTSVVSCPMYALLLTGDKHATADVAVGLSIAGVGTGSVSGKWHLHSTSGIWRSGGEDGNSKFHPLYTLRMPKSKSLMKRILRRRGEVVPTGEDTFCAYPPPWGELDEEGEELPLSEDSESEDEKD